MSRTKARAKAYYFSDGKWRVKFDGLIAVVYGEDKPYLDWADKNKIAIKLTSPYHSGSWSESLIGYDEVELESYSDAMLFYLSFA